MLLLVRAGVRVDRVRFIQVAAAVGTRQLLEALYCLVDGRHHVAQHVRLALGSAWLHGRSGLVGGLAVVAWRRDGVVEIVHVGRGKLDQRLVARQDVLLQPVLAEEPLE
jgi:hypothetical protein